MEFLIKDEKLIRSIIIQNADNPQNYLGKHKLKNASEFNSNTCSDHYYYVIDEHKKTLIKYEFTGEGCVISKAATSIAIKETINKKKDEIIKIIDSYFEMIENGENKEGIGLLNIFSNISNHPNRKTCATIWAQVLKQEVLKW